MGQAHAPAAAALAVSADARYPGKHDLRRLILQDAAADRSALPPWGLHRPPRPLPGAWHGLPFRAFAPHLPVRHHSPAKFVTPATPSGACAISVLRLTFLVGNSLAANGLARNAGDCCSQRFSLGSRV